MKLLVYHPRVEFSGIAYGQKFVRGVAEITNKSLGQRFAGLGFKVVEAAPPPEPAPELVSESKVPSKAPVSFKKVKAKGE